MRTDAQKSIKFHHTLADIQIRPEADVNVLLLKRLIQLALDSYLETDKISAAVVHNEARKRHGDNYQTPGYYLKIYRTRSDMTQVQLAKKAKIKQHHLSEMENNKRTIGKKLAKVLADILKCDYRKLL